MNIYRDIIQPIVGHLKDQVSNCAVEEMPDSPSTYKLIHPRAALLVQYASSPSYTPLTSASQMRRIEVDVHILARSIQGNENVYGYLDQVLAALHGYRLQVASTPMYPVRDRPLPKVADFWQYVVTFSFTAIHTGQL